MTTAPAAPPAFSEVVTIDEAAAWLRVNRKTLYDAARSGKLPCARLGRRVLLSRSAIEAWLAGGKP